MKEKINQTAGRLKQTVRAAGAGIATLAASFFMSAPAYEIPVFHKALSECGSLEVRPVAICVPQEIQEYCTELFGEDVQIAAASHDLFAKQVNGQIYRPLVEKYIAGEKRL